MEMSLMFSIIAASESAVFIKPVIVRRNQNKHELYLICVNVDEYYEIFQKNCNNN